VQVSLETSSARCNSIISVDDDFGLVTKKTEKRLTKRMDGSTIKKVQLDMTKVSHKVCLINSRDKTK
jgi:hypothetical protein